MFILQRTGEKWAWVDTVHAWCDTSSDTGHTSCPHARAAAWLAPRTWKLHFEGGRGIDEHTFPSAGDALSALAIEAREGWQGVRDLGRPDLPADPPDDDAEAIRIFTTALDLVYLLDVTAGPTLTYHRRLDYDSKREIVVRARVEGAGDVWGVTVVENDAPFDPCIEVRLNTGQFEALAGFPAFFHALADRKPGTLDEMAALLDELGVTDDTAGYERRRAESDAALARHLYADDDQPL